MSKSIANKFPKLSLLLVGVVCSSMIAPAQSSATLTPTVVVPPTFSRMLTERQKAAIANITPARLQYLQNTIAPRLKALIQSQQTPAITGNFRGWREIISQGTPMPDANAAVASGAQSTGVTATHSSATAVQLRFTTSMGNYLTVTPTTREYHPGANNLTNTVPLVRGPGCGQPVCPIGPAQPPADQDGDGLPDNPIGNRDFEDTLANEFIPNYGVSAGEQQQFATFADYVPMTVTGLLGTTPPSIYTHVSPLGLTTDPSGNQIFAIRVDYLTLWNADGGLIGGGGACFYSLFGLDDVVNELSGHNLDVERSVMLLGAPAVNGSYNPDVTQYSLYSVYTAAHEGTFFDQSEYADFSTPVSAGNHLNLDLSLSKHSTYSFNPNYYPITPQYFIDATNAALASEYADGDLSDDDYLFYTAAANDTFYGCLVEQFSDQGVSPGIIWANVGEVAQPINASHFIQDTGDLDIADKLTNPIF